MTSTTSNSNNVGNKVGEGAKGFFGAIHGAGEAIRGTINSTIDGLGDGVVGRNHGDVTSVSNSGTSDNVARSGIDEVRESLAKLKGSTSGSTTV